jgi:heterodisulfide reductase subunit B
MKTIGYYPGCSLCGSASDYDHSLRAVVEKLQTQLQEVPNWVCCGATSAHALDHEATLCLAADNLAKASEAGLRDVLAPCAMCYQRLAIAAHELSSKPALRQRVTKALGRPESVHIEQVRPLSLLNWLSEVPEETLKASITQPLAGLKVACYYGCLLVRPPKITGESNYEMPQSMERVLRVTGAEPVRWSMATECCGASFGISRTESVVRLTKSICQSARKAGADMICLACPMCHANLDMRQGSGDAGVPPIPVVYLTQLLGLAMGCSSDRLGLDSHFVPVEPVLTGALGRAKQAASV